MAIPIEGCTVDARRDRIQHLLDEGKVMIPNARELADESLWRCSFMTEVDAARFAKSLESLGLNTSQGPDPDVVIVNEFDLTVAPYCEWLLTARFEKAVIAWLVGTDPRTVTAPEGWDPKIGSGFRYLASKDGLEFVRLDENNVEVYRDKATGQLTYVGRTTAPVESLFRTAGEIIVKHFRVAGQTSITGKDADDVARAIAMLDKALAEVQNDWRIHWFHGKGHVALGDLSIAYDSFHRAYALEKNDQAIPRELAATCLTLGKFDEGLQFAERAVVLEPDSHELLGNLALAHLFVDNVEAAQRSIKAAQAIQPTNTINSHLAAIINDVATGQRPLPKSMDDLHSRPRPYQQLPQHQQPPRQQKKFWQFWKK